MKEKEIRLTSEEIDYLLKGTIHWEDIAKQEDAPLRRENVNRKNFIEKKALEEDYEHRYGDKVEHRYEDKFVDEFEESFQETEPFWSGAKVYIILSLMGSITLGTWAYFVFA